MTQYKVAFKDMSSPDDEWIVIDPENIELMISEDILDNFELPEMTDSLSQAIIMARAIHMLDGYKGYHTKVFDAESSLTVHYFILDTVDLIQRDWMKQLANHYNINEDIYESAIKYEYGNLNSKGFKDIFSHLNQRK